MEHRKYAATAENIVLICQHYGISSDYLLGLSDTPERKQ